MRSIQRQLAIGMVGVAAVGAALFTGVAYRLILVELDESLDKTLREVAYAVAERPAGGTAVPAAPRPPRDGEIVVIEWAPDGRGATYRSHDGVPLHMVPQEGLARQHLGADDWDVYTAVRGERVVQAAQRAGFQQHEAAEAAARLYAPFALLFGAIAVASVALLRRGLRPLDVAARDIGERSADSLAPVELATAPRELQPLVLAVNRLMQRLDAALGARRRFVADAAHELRTPISALKLQLELLDGAPDEPARQRARSELQAGLARAQRLVAQLLDLSRAEPGREAPHRRLSLGELARQAVAEASMVAEARGIDLGARVEDPGLIDGEADALRMLIGNLVGNALRFTPAGGVVDVVVESAAGCALLRVIDPGPGIPIAEREAVFERFHRVPGSRPAHADESGSGLGLAIVAAVAERHGAAVTLHDAPEGRGLEARVVFPRPAPVEAAG